MQAKKLKWVRMAGPSFATVTTVNVPNLIVRETRVGSVCRPLFPDV